ncbi:hypothetical protein [Actinopolymorpha pittospori]|uniref:Uncharacterized protein n=1 Tax=Actinopolymorpha pittospori TaxID=648752 RepID=A0A927RI13_9ACTN|nr:hypothetical protein [Actinopolymorpha pittospori]MBE1605716.1 hypothetical protein [Actinopolymorpha pittospori]
MSVLSLTPPLDITWTRIAFSRDMIDTNFGDATFGPKWRSSLAVYYYVVPDEETADAYPNSRIVYLKLTCSITGFNPSEGLAGAKQIAEESGALDDLQRSTWEVVTASGWSAKYWPCLGAIMQLAVYPNGGGDVDPDDYPYILDFEPKKREMYESVSEGSEFLSGSQDKTEITKGSTSVSGLEIGGSAGFSIGGFGASGSVTHTSSDTNINQKTTDTSREARETLSRTTQSSQMYQLFNGYHLGSNRALFVVAPRPHTVSDQSQTEFNLIDGARKLEGIQEVFVVVHMPKDLPGFCLQAGLDTGHQVTTLVPYHSLMARRIDDGGPPLPNGGGVPPVPPPNPPTPPPATPIRQLVVTRRVVQSCGTFDENGLLQINQLSEPPPPRPIVHGEIGIVDVATQVAYARLASDPSTANRAGVANALNAVQTQVTRLMMDRHTAVGYEPRDLADTDTFRSLVANAAREDPTPVAELVRAGHLTDRDLRDLESRKVRTMSELFAMEMSDADSAATADIRSRAIASLTAIPQVG